jgi:hypothetical protein
MFEDKEPGRVFQLKEIGSNRRMKKSTEATEGLYTGGRTCSTHGEMRNAYIILIGTHEGNGRFEDIDLCRLEINIKIEPGDKGYERVGWIHLRFLRMGLSSELS